MVIACYIHDITRYIYCHAELWKRNFQIQSLIYLNLLVVSSHHTALSVHRSKSDMLFIIFLTSLNLMFLLKNPNNAFNPNMIPNLESGLSIKSHGPPHHQTTHPSSSYIFNLHFCYFHTDVRWHNNL